MAVSRRLRFEILRRDNFACRYCGAKAPDNTLTVDHVIPTALGGGDEPNNLVTACDLCNSGKASVNPGEELVADVDAAALLWARAIERANRLRREQLNDLEALLRRFHSDWSEYGGDADALDRDFGRPSNWADSVTRFLENGLTTDELERFVSIAMASSASTRNVWRYFCGVCWNEIGRRQELARRLIEDEEV